jgi:hypothetical protein
VSLNPQPSSINRLGRFMSEDPKLFAAGDYNLFRYCHNDPIDFTDPMGLTDTALPPGPNHANSLIEAAAEDRSYNFIMGLMQRQFSSAISAGTVGYQQWSAWSASQAMRGLSMAYMPEGARMHTYSLKSQYNIGDLSGARGYQYVWDPNEDYSGQCMTTVQYLSGAPSSRTPLVRGDPVGPNTKRGTAIATGFELRNGQWVYPSKPSGNHAAFLVAPIGRGFMQTLEAQRGVSIHLDRQPMADWYEVTSRLPPSATSTSELRSSGGLYGPFY